MKIFQMNDCDWMAGEDLESVTADYLENYTGGQTAEEAFEDAPFELPDEALDRLRFREEDGVRRTFREQLAFLIEGGQRFPCFFASTEC